MSAVREMLERELGAPVKSWQLRARGGVMEPTRLELEVEMIALNQTDAARLSTHLQDTCTDYWRLTNQTAVCDFGYTGLRTCGAIVNQTISLYPGILTTELIMLIAVGDQ